MSDFKNLNDNSNPPPRLRIGHTLWNMERLPINSTIEWPLEEKLCRIKDAGFEHVECWIGDDQHGRDIVGSMKQKGLHLALGHRPNTIEQTIATVELAARFEAQWVLCQPASA
jgi:sugar phosphate isomerase/epimerase